MKKHIFCVLLAAVLAFGLFMPELALETYERRLEGGSVEIQNNDISLSIGQDYDYFESLYLFTECSIQLELTEGNRMTGDQAAEKCKELRKRFFPNESESLAHMSVRPYLLAKGNDMASSAIYWMACWYDENGDFDGTVWIDDEKGLLISCGGRLRHEMDNDNEMVVYASPLKDAAVLISTYYLEVKGVENAAISGDDDEYIISLMGESSDKCFIRVFRQSDDMFYVVPHRVYLE